MIVLTCFLKCPVRLVMRFHRIDWTSGEPVSPAVLAVSLMTSVCVRRYRIVKRSRCDRCLQSARQV